MDKKKKTRVVNRKQSIDKAKEDESLKKEDKSTPDEMQGSHITEDEEIKPMELKQKKPRKKKMVSATEINPFSKNWKLPVNTSYDLIYIGDSTIPKRIDMIDDQDFESIQQGDFRPYLIDETHARIFQTDNDNLRKKIYSMKGKEAVLLLYIILNLEPGNHSIILQEGKVAQKLHIGRSSFFNYINELITLNIIARSEEQNKYYINIQHFSAGTRGYSFSKFCYSRKDGSYELIKQKIQNIASEIFSLQKAKRNKK